MKTIVNYNWILDKNGVFLNIDLGKLSESDMGKCTIDNQNLINVIKR